MEPLTLVATAVALGACEGARETAKQMVVDAYATLKRFLLHRYEGVTKEIEGIESEPDEELRRELLAKQLGKAGADGDEELQALAQEVLRQVEENAPETAAAIGVRLTRVTAGGNLSVTDIDVEGSSGVTAEDVAVGGDLTISGVNVRSAPEPPHPSQARR
ncbi:hypothetical protein ABIC28_005186 [Rhodococcus sp. PvR044]|uniref:hypothetical protein n=1 Tax=Rhodococcus sp. PvR044 TaxID=3156402 RepID=UPI003391BD9E